MMHDERLQELIKDAAPEYLTPNEPPIDAMWAKIEAEHFDGAGRASRTHGQRRRWTLRITGIAATLLVGVGIGRFSAAPAAAPAPLDPFVVAATAEPVVGVAEPLQRATSRYLDDAALLLASIPASGTNSDTRFSDQAGQLLTMTRLLLDSPAASDPRLRDLLEDIELVLAQVARLRASPHAEELTFIAAAMDERDVVPRIRTAAASMSPANF
jgi:hypothetical protein